MNILIYAIFLVNVNIITATRLCNNLRLSKSNRFKVPRIVQQPRGGVAILNRTYRLSCRSSYEDYARTFWEHEGERVNIEAVFHGTGIKRYEISDRGELMFNRVQLDDMGRYRCHVQNRYCQVYSRYVKLDIHAPATIINWDISEIKPIKVVYNQSLQFQCHVVAIPPASVAWFRDNQRIVEGQSVVGSGQLVRVMKRRRSYQEVLVILRMRATDSGRYTCRAENHMISNVTGHDEKTVSILVSSNPVFKKSSVTPSDSLCFAPYFCDLCRKYVGHHSLKHAKDAIRVRLNNRRTLRTTVEAKCVEWVRAINSYANISECRTLIEKLFCSYRYPQCPVAVYPQLVTTICRESCAMITRMCVADSHWSTSFPDCILLPSVNNVSMSCDILDVTSLSQGNSSLQTASIYIVGDRQTLIIVVSICGGVVLVVVSILIFICLLCQGYVPCRHLAYLDKYRLSYNLTARIDDYEFDLNKIPINRSCDSVKDNSGCLQKLLATFEYPRNNVEFVRDLGHGAYGRVFQAKAPRIHDGCRNCYVAVKMLKDDATDELRGDFEHEALLIASFDHPNIIRMLGVCGTGKPACLILEYMQHGDLHDFLRLNHPDQRLQRQNQELPHVSLSEELDDDTKIYICEQIAAGMEYLSRRHYVHRDLATRNCLIGRYFVVKIADFALTQSICDETKYYEGNDSDPVPVRWMPTEVILYNRYYIASDVWSFGVVMWEVFSYAEQPYGELSHEEVVHFVKSGEVLDSPIGTPSHIYDLMLDCWTFRPSDRPSFTKLHSKLYSLHSFSRYPMSRNQLDELIDI